MSGCLLHLFRAWDRLLSLRLGARRLCLTGCLVAILGLAGPLPAQPLSPADVRLSVPAAPNQDDATLHDVVFHGPLLGLAVGDRGTIWRTADGGRTWEFRSTPTTASLRSVCLVSDQLGWAAGVRIEPGTRISVGVLLATTNGGRTWTRVDRGQLPGLARVQFFDAQHGCLAGESTDVCATGLFTTEDGGLTWTEVRGARASGWTAAAFTDPRNGVVVGRRDQQATLGNGTLLPFAAGASLRTLHGVVLDRRGWGWAVGDGGAIRMTTDRGASWPAPPATPPASIRDVQDFHAVAARGDRVWVAGTPGSVVWHSGDAGLTWSSQATGDATPIRGMCFTSDLAGCAVGEFGSIRVTQDGGRSWLPIRGGSRRPALLALHAHPEQSSMKLLAREAVENGYRCVTSVAARREVGASTSANAASDEAFRAAQLAAGGSEAWINWRLPLSLPELDRHREALIAEWSRVLENKLPQVMLGGLVATIRAYRPEVIVYDEAAADDAVTKLLGEAILLAIDQAADPSRFPEQRSQLGLAPWTVSKVFARVAESDRATLTIDPHQIAPRQGTTLNHAAARAAAHAFPPRPVDGEKEFYRLRQMKSELALQGGPQPETSPLGRAFFAGLNLPTGGEVRRELPLLTGLNDEQLAVLSRHQRNFTAYAESALDDVGRAGELLAQIRGTIAPLPPAEAAEVLVDLAEEYRRRSQWEHAEETLVELIEHFPDQPAAREAMRWLYARWTSQEVLWQRLRAITAQSPSVTFSPQVLLANFETAANAASTAENSAQLEQTLADLPSPHETQVRGGSIRTGDFRTFADQGARSAAGSPVTTGTDQLSQEVIRRRQRAARLDQLLGKFDPRLQSEPDLQFMRAAFLRSIAQTAPAQEIYRQYFGIDDGITPWNATARGELWATSRGSLSPKPVLRCVRAASPPVLDGLLSDPCWVDAPEVRLMEDAAVDPDDPTFVGNRSLPSDASQPAQAVAERAPIVMLCYDDRYLYLAASVPKQPAVPDAAVQYAGRARDADLRGRDRLTFAFDIDRDYATWYRFDVDQRGWTGDALWDDVRWNPDWFVAAESETATWRMEAAIPLEQLTPTPPSRGDVWAAGIQRIIPTVGLQGWTHPTSLAPRGETLGLVQFD